MIEYNGLGEAPHAKEKGDDGVARRQKRSNGVGVGLICTVLKGEVRKSEWLVVITDEIA